MNYSNYHNEKRRKAFQSRTTKLRKKVAIITFRVVVAGLLLFAFWVGGMGLGAYFSIIANAPAVPFVDVFDDTLTTIVYDNQNNEIARFSANESREYATLDQIPEHLKLAFVALEDERFYSHNGVDFKGFVRGMYMGIKYGTFQGGSTITQQYIKNSIGLMRNTIETKLQEQYMAINFEREVMKLFDGDKVAAKDFIAELYMNIIYFGRSQYGVRDAASYYFNKDLMDLTIAESCVIVAITQNPSLRDPVRFPEQNQRRQRAGIEKMFELGFITEEQYLEALEEDVYANINVIVGIREESSSKQHYFIDMVYSEVSKHLQESRGITSREASNLIYRGGLKIYTTWDTSIQNIVDEIYILGELFMAERSKFEVTYLVSIRNTLTGRDTHRQFKGSVNRMDQVPDLIEKMREGLLGQDDIIIAERHYPVIQPQSGFVIMDYRTGHVAAIAGGRGEKLTGMAFNRATQAQRQPGSVFKVLASYLPGIDKGVITAATVLDDAPFATEELYGGKPYEPGNWYEGFRGLSTVRMGVRDSMNVITVKNMINTGLEDCFDYLLNLGFGYGTGAPFSLRPQDRNNPAIALGGITNGVTQLESAAAFAAIANNGVYLPPTFYTRVLDKDNNIILEYNPEPKQVIKQTSAYILTSMLVSAVQDPGSTGLNARLTRNGQIWMPVAGKTGTTQTNRDLTFVGYTPYFVASIHLGHDQPEPLSTSSTHLHVWRTIMDRVHTELGLERREFEEPDGIIRVSICQKSGKLPVNACRNCPQRGAANVREEVFATGTAPTDFCDVHAYFTRCAVSGLRASSGCTSTNSVVWLTFPSWAYRGPGYISDRQHGVRAFCDGSHTVYNPAPDGDM
jgi:penicillin-binding protein 1A